MSGRQYLKSLRKNKDSPGGVGSPDTKTSFMSTVPLTTSESDDTPPLVVEEAEGQQATSEIDPVPGGVTNT